MAIWNHRIIEHRNSSEPDHEIYFTVHEVYYGKDGLPYAFVASGSSPLSKEEAEMLVRAYDKPAVAWVDDASFCKDGYGFHDYAVWEWLGDATEKPRLGKGLF